jgi:hypothetical protein
MRESFPAKDITDARLCRTAEIFRPSYLHVRKIGLRLAQGGRITRLGNNRAKRLESLIISQEFSAPIFHVAEGKREFAIRKRAYRSKDNFKYNGTSAPEVPSVVPIRDLVRNPALVLISCNIHLGLSVFIKLVIGNECSFNFALWGKAALI